MGTKKVIDPDEGIHPSAPPVINKGESKVGPLVKDHTITKPLGGVGKRTKESGNKGVDGKTSKPLTKPVKLVNTKNPKQDGTLSARQRLFVEAYVVCADAKQAAITAGYSPKSAANKASQLLNSTEYPHIKRAIDLLKIKKEESVLKSADDILKYIHTAMFFEPLRFFQPGERGGWLIDEEGWKSLPPAIGCLIEEVQRRVVVRGEGDTRTEEVTYWVKLVSKSTAMTLAAKHQLGEKLNIVYTHINWNDLYAASQQVNDAILNDPIEQLIASKEQTADLNNTKPSIKLLPTKITTEPLLDLNEGDQS